MKNLTSLLLLLFFMVSFSNNAFTQAKQEENTGTIISDENSFPGALDVEKNFLEVAKKADWNQCISCYDKIQELKEQYQDVANNLCQTLYFTVICCMQNVPITAILNVKPDSFHCNSDDGQ